MQFQGIVVLALGLAVGGRQCGAQTQSTDAEAERRAIQQNAVTDRYLTTAQIEMASTVDTKSAVAGQEISAKLLQPIKLADGTALPAATRLLGHVTRARSGGPEQGSAILVLNFDRAEVAAGKIVPVRCVIRAVAENHMPPGSRAGSSAPQMGDASIGGSRRGGVAGGMPGTVPSIGSGGAGNAGTGLPPMGPSEDAGGPGGTSGSGLPSGSGSGPVISSRGPAIDPIAMSSPAVDRKVEEEGETLRGAARATGLPGVILFAAPTASGMLTAAGRNFSVEAGTQMTLGVIGR